MLPVSQPTAVETAPAIAVIPSLNSLGASARVTVRLWDAEGNSATPFLQYQVSGSPSWHDATLLSLDGGPYSTSTRVAAVPTGSEYTLIWDAAKDLGGNGVTNVLLRARAKDFMLLGDWSVATPFQVAMAGSTNGIPSWWLLQHFGRADVDPNADPDGDGFTNLQEYQADTDPLDRNSFLRITCVTLLSDGVKLDWQGGTLATQYLQRNVELGGTNVWLNIFTSVPPTPIFGTYTDSLGTNAMQFYRVKTER